VIVYIKYEYEAGLMKHFIENRNASVLKMAERRAFLSGQFDQARRVWLRNLKRPNPGLSFKAFFAFSASALFFASRF